MRACAYTVLLLYGIVHGDYKCTKEADALQSVQVHLEKSVPITRLTTDEFYFLQNEVYVYYQKSSFENGVGDVTVVRVRNKIGEPQNQVIWRLLLIKTTISKIINTYNFFCAYDGDSFYFSYIALKASKPLDRRSGGEGIRHVTKAFSNYIKDVKLYASSGAIPLLEDSGDLRFLAADGTIPVIPTLEKFVSLSQDTFIPSQTDLLKVYTRVPGLVVRTPIRLFGGLGVIFTPQPWIAPLFATQLLFATCKSVGLEDPLTTELEAYMNALNVCNSKEIASMEKVERILRNRSIDHYRQQKLLNEPPYLRSRAPSQEKNSRAETGSASLTSHRIRRSFDASEGEEAGCQANESSFVSLLSPDSSPQQQESRSLVSTRAWSKVRALHSTHKD